LAAAGVERDTPMAADPPTRGHGHAH